MNKVTLKIKVLLEEMGKAEKKVAHWILEHPGEILPLSIVELAEQEACSEATIVRFSQHLGFTGYQELKIALARETKSAVVNAHMTAEDTAFEIYEKVCNDIYCSLERTKKVLDADVLQAAADAIMAAGKIIVMGLGKPRFRSIATWFFTLPPRKPSIIFWRSIQELHSFPLLMPCIFILYISSPPKRSLLLRIQKSRSKPKNIDLQAMPEAIYTLMLTKFY